MRLLETSIVYGLLGLVVGGTMLLRSERPRDELTSGRLLLAFLFWPLLAPAVLARRGPPGGPSVSPRRPTGFEERSHAAEARLLAALGKLEQGVAEEVLAPQVARIRALGGSLRSMAERLAEIEEILSSPEFDETDANAALADLRARGHGDDDPRVLSVRSRLRNIERLCGMRARTRDDLERALLKIEEMASQVLLLKFAGKPDAEVVRLVKEVAESVEGITDALLAVE